MQKLDFAPSKKLSHINRLLFYKKDKIKKRTGLRVHKIQVNIRSFLVDEFTLVLLTNLLTNYISYYSALFKVPR